MTDDEILQEINPELFAERNHLRQLLKSQRAEIADMAVRMARILAEGAKYSPDDVAGRDESARFFYDAAIDRACEARYCGVDPAAQDGARALEEAAGALLPFIVLN